MYAVLKAASCCTPNSSEANSHGWIMRGKFGKERGMVTSVNKDSSSVVLRRFERFSFLGTVDIFCSVLQQSVTQTDQSRRTVLTQNNYRAMMSINNRCSQK